MKKINKKTQEIVDNMNKEMLNTYKFYKDMQKGNDEYSEKYSDKNLEIELKTMAKVFNSLLVSQYGLTNHTIAGNIWVWDCEVLV
jgi:hypothetical protein